MKRVFYTVVGLFMALILLPSCKDFQQYFSEQFPELDTLTYLRADGTILLPVANSTVSLSDVLPDKVGKFWIEVDSDSLLHIRGYQPSAININVLDLGFSSDISAGTPIPQATIPNLESALFDIPNVQDIPGIFYVADPKIVAYIRSEMALDFNVNITSIYLENTQTGENGTYASNISIPIVASPPDTAFHTQAVVDTSNFPEFPDALLFKPNKMKFVFDIVIPDQTLQYDLITTQKVTADLSIDIPFVFYAKDVIIIDTSDFNLDLTKFEQVQSLTVDLKMIINNDIPLGGRFYLIITDSTITDTIGVIPSGTPDLVNDTINLVIGTKPVTASAAFKFDAAQTNEQGEAIQPYQTITHFVMPNYMVQNIRNYGNKHMKLLVIAKFNTYNADQGQLVRIYSYNKFSLKIGAKIDYAVAF
jgi:hypothetical protein